MLRKSVLLLGTQILFGATLLLNNLVIAQFLGPAGRGMLALLVFVPTLTVTLVNLGFHLSAIYFLSRKADPVHEVFGTILYLTLFMSVFLVGGIVLFWSPIQCVVYRGLSTTEVLTSLASLPALLLIFYFDGLWLAIDRVAATISVRLCQSSVYFLAGLVMVGLLRQGVFGGILAFTIGAYAATVLILGWVFHISWRWPTFSWKLLKRGLKFGLATHSGNVADYALYRSDTFLLSYLGSFQQLGYYSFAVPLAELIWWLSTAVRQVLFVRTSQAVAGEANHITPVALRSTLALAGVMAGGVFIGGTAGIYFLLPAFAPALPVLAILLVATVTALIFQLTLSDLTSRGWGARSSQIALTVLPFGIMAYVVLIPRLGIIGAALGSLFAYALEAALSLFWFWKLTGISPWKMLIPTRSDFALVLQLTGRLMQRQP